MQWLRGCVGGARGSAATGVGPTGGSVLVGFVGSASHPALNYKGARQCLVGRASFGQARASAPPPAFPHLRAKGLLSLLLPTRPPGAEVRNRAQRSSSGGEIISYNAWLRPGGNLRSAACQEAGARVKRTMYIQSIYYGGLHVAHLFPTI